jgi:suppressor of ftsI
VSTMLRPCSLGLILALLAPSSLPAQAQGDTLRDPPNISSANGLLQASLTIAPRTVTVAGRQLTTNLYNGLYAPQTLHVKPGDSVALMLRNCLRPTALDTSSTTNLHYHGWAVTPHAPGDDVFIHVPTCPVPGSTYQYGFRVPLGHPEGMFWYHPHPHGVSEPQVLGGLSGALVVDGLLGNNFPEASGFRERVMLLKDVVFPGDSDTLPKTKSINGQLRPIIPIHPGEFQFWRLANIGADAYFNIAVDSMPFWVIAIDGNTVTKPFLARNHLLPPGARVEILIQGAAAGSYAFRSRMVDTGPAGDPNPEVVLATVVSAGTPRFDARQRRVLLAALKRGPLNRGHVAPTPDQLRGMAPTRYDTLDFSENAAGTVFYINGKTFDPNRVDTRVSFGTVAEWTIRNWSTEVHAFHIHQLDYLVTEVNGQSQFRSYRQDTVQLPYSDGKTPTVVKIKLWFTGANITGKFVYHCHILEHEDAGMMATILLADSAAAPAAAAGD